MSAMAMRTGTSSKPRFTDSMVILRPMVRPVPRAAWVRQGCGEGYRAPPLAKASRNSHRRGVFPPPRLQRSADLASFLLIYSADASDPHPRDRRVRVHSTIGPVPVSSRSRLSDHPCLYVVSVRLGV